jgi:predicted transcriptional regulator
MRQRKASKTLDGPAIGKRIVKARNEAGGMSGRELAEYLDVSERSVRDYESGATIPWKHFGRLEQLSGHAMEWFLYGREPRDPAAERHEELMATLKSMDRRMGERDRRLTRELKTLAGAVRDAGIDARRATHRSPRG